MASYRSFQIALKRLNLTRRGNCDSQQGFTLVELLVVIAIIGALVALLLPAIQAAREASRRSACQNNLRQIGLSLLNFESAHEKLPPGAKAQLSDTFPNVSFGMSWFVEIFPYLEQSSLYDQLDKSGAHNGSILLHKPLLHKPNGKVVDGIVIGTMFCPSSSLSLTLAVGGMQLMMPSYVGISGAANSEAFVESRVNPCCLPALKGEISGGGYLIPNRGLRLQEVPDGLSHSVVVGECSDFIYDQKGEPVRIDGGHRQAGWLMGTGATDTPPQYSVPLPAYNITTIQYLPNSQSYNRPGIDTDNGPNNPLNSAHVNGVNAIALDGAVSFVGSEIELDLLKQLATRDDGQLENSVAK